MNFARCVIRCARCTWNAECSQAIGVFTAYTAWTEGLRYAIVPHLYLIAAYEIAQRLFPKNIGALPVRSPSLRQKLTYGPSAAVEVPQVPTAPVQKLQYPKYRFPA